MMNSYKSIGRVVGTQRLRSIFMGAKASLLGGSSLPKAERLQRLLIHRNVEKKIFGEILSLPGEEDFVKETRNQMPSYRERQGLPQQNGGFSPSATQKDPRDDTGPRLLADELSRRKINSVALTIAGAILSAAITSAANIEQMFWAESSKPEKFKDDDFQDLIAEFIYVFLHLCERDSFEAIPDPRKRSVFLDSVLDLVRLLGTTLTMTDYHAMPAFTQREDRTEPGILVVTGGIPLLTERQAEYLRLTLFATKQGPQLTGTLFWEFERNGRPVGTRTPDLYRVNLPRIQKTRT
jgi:hypothetical protein